MQHSRKPGLPLLVSWVVLLLATSYCPRASAVEFQLIPDEPSLSILEPQSINMIFGKAMILRSTTDVDRALVAEPEVVSVRPISAREIYVRPVSVGITNLILWQDQEVVAIYEVNVVYDLSRLKQRLFELFPNELELRVMSDPDMDSITLAGRVSSTSNLDQILTMVEAFAPRENIRNLVRVGGVHQVMLEVQVAEVKVNALKRMGVNFNLINMAGQFEIGFLSETPTNINLGIGSMGIRSSPDNNNWQWQGLFDALKENRLAKILAEPSLVALSGQTASFVSGGEIPIPVLDREGNVGVEFRPFGIQLAFTPTVLDGNRIAIEVEPSVSELDSSTSISILGALIPGTTVRKASTSVELRDGQSFAIAGLLSENFQEGVSMFPGLGNLPILGALFSSKDFQSRETELVILITPRLVKPILASEQPVPTDFYIPPDDAEFFLLGISGQSHRHQGPSRSADFDGQFGHVLVP